MPYLSCHKVYSRELMKFYYVSKILILFCKFSTVHFIVGNIYMRRTQAETLDQCIRKALSKSNLFSIPFLPQHSFT